MIEMVIVISAIGPYACCEFLKELLKQGASNV